MSTSRTCREADTERLWELVQQRPGGTSVGELAELLGRGVAYVHKLVSVDRRFIVDRFGGRGRCRVRDSIVLPRPAAAAAPMSEGGW